MKPAKRIESLPPYLFARIDALIEEKKSKGIDVISLGIGDPVEPTPEPIQKALIDALNDPENHRYPSYYGLKEFRQAASEWFKNRFGVELDPDREILPLIGSKEGIAHLPVALVNSGDVVLVPDPGYPVYETATILADGEPYLMPLKAENEFLPDIDSIPESVLKRVKIMYLNYPNNPTSAIAPDEFFKKAIDLALKFGFVIAHDAAYSEITFDGYKAPSILEFEGARDCCVEFHSLSKSFNMTGWRIGFLTGNSEVVKHLGTLKTNIDSGIFNPIQYAGIEALRNQADFPEDMVRIYDRRRKLVQKTLDECGIEYHKSPATIYIWARVPDGMTSDQFVMKLVDEAGVVVSPGAAYGPSGEGYFRISLTVKDDRLQEALERIRKVLT